MSATFRAVWLGLSFFVAVDANAITYEAIPETHDIVSIGQGFNSLGGIAYSANLSHCVQKSKLSPLSDTTGEKVYLYMDRITSLDELKSDLTASQEFSAGYLPFSSEKDEAKAQKLNFFSMSMKAKGIEKSFNHYSDKANYVFVLVRKVFQAEMMDQVEISERQLKLFGQRPQDFFHTCGDKYIAGVKKGAEVMAIMRCEASSAEEKKNWDERMDAKAGYHSFSSAADVSATFEELRKRSQDRCKFIVEAQGGSGTFKAKEGPDFTESAINYVSSATPGTATPLEFFTRTYRDVLDLEFWENVLDKVDLELVEQRRFVTERRELIKKFMEFQDMLDRSHTADSRAATIAIDHIDTLNKQIEACIRNPYDSKACREPVGATKLAPGVTLKPFEN